MTLPNRLGRSDGHVCDRGESAHGYKMHMHMHTYGLTMKYTTQSHGSIDHVLDLAIHYRQYDIPNLILSVQPAVSPSRDFAEHPNHMRIDLKPDQDAAAVMITLGPDLYDPSSWISKTDKPRPGMRLCWDCWIGSEARFPDDAIITIPELRQVVHQFYDLNGVRLPTAVDWHQMPESMW